MKALTYRIALHEPTLVTEFNRDPNSDVAANYLPGSVLRGAFINRFIRHRRRINSNYEFDPAAPDERRLFFNGETRYLNGYPSVGRERSLPTPRSWYQEKEDLRNSTQGYCAEVHDLSVDGLESLEQPQGVGQPFFATSGAINFVKPRRHLAVHTARTRRFGRAVSPNIKGFNPAKGDTRGAVYRYDSLAGKQDFAAVILCEQDSDAQMLVDLLAGSEGEIVLGGSRSSGYGLVSIRDAVIEEGSHWREYRPIVTDADVDLDDIEATDEEDNLNDLATEGVHGGSVESSSSEAEESSSVRATVKITFLSDALVRNENGQFSVDLSCVTRELASKLPNSVLKPIRERSFLSGKILGAFNRRWGLPLPQSLAIQMGSVIVFELQNRDEVALSDLTWQGVGERRAEGFGRIAIDMHELPTMPVEILTEEYDEPHEEEQSHDLVAQGGEILDRIRIKLLRTRLDRHLTARASRIKISKCPSNSQIARLRHIIHTQLMQDFSLHEVNEHRKNIKQRTSARKQFEQAFVGHESLLKWLKRHLEYETEDEVRSIETWKELLNLQTTWGNYQPLIGGLAPEVTSLLRRQYMLRFIDLVLARAAKDVKEK